MHNNVRLIKKLDPSYKSIFVVIECNFIQLESSFQNYVLKIKLSNFFFDIPVMK